jgi:hypothetical protein
METFRRPAANPEERSERVVRKFVGIVGLGLAAALLSACAPTGAGLSGCRVERAAGSTASAVGGLGNPPTHLTQDEIDAMAACLGPALDVALAKARDATIRATRGWRTMSTTYVASEHGMFLQVFANASAASDYAKAEQGSRLLPGAAILKRSFHVDRAGNATPGSLYLMERMAPGYDSSTNDWRFTVTTPEGLRLGESGGEDAPAVAFCAGCHKSARVQDFLFFVPPRFRVAN